ncbi:MAG: FISUMP domain-containing protein [Bacteroidales bacterium]|jgi:uncharacterized protein (TIGR02145 family)
MTRTTLTLVLLLLAGNFLPVPGQEADRGTFTDVRDGHEYSWVRIGSQVWMAENLAWLPQVYGPGNYSYEDRLYFVYGYNGSDTAAAKNHHNYLNYGVLYNWHAATDGAKSSDKSRSGIRGACPEGWHLPSRVEWETMEEQLKLPDFPSGYLSDPTGFNAQAGGFYGIDDAFWELDQESGFWTSTVLSDAAAFHNGYTAGESFLTLSAVSKALGFYVRCVRNQ